MNKLLALLSQLSNYKKSIVAGVGFLCELIIQLGIGGEAQKWATLIVGALTALGVYSLCNVPSPASKVSPPSQ